MVKNYPHYLQSLQEATRKYWNKPALNTIGGDSLTYAQMATDIARFHIVFEKAGFKKGDKIALCANNGAKWGFAYLAVNTYETVIVPILADFTPESVMGLVNHSDSIALPVGPRWTRKRCRLSRWPLMWITGISCSAAIPRFRTP